MLLIDIPDHVLDMSWMSGAGTEQQAPFVPQAADLLLGDSRQRHRLAVHDRAIGIF